MTVGGQPEQAVVEACPQADGRWRITQTTPGLPEQVYTVPQPTAYPCYFPSLPAILAVQKGRHFRHGFSRGFGRRFATGSRHFAGTQAGHGR